MKKAERIYKEMPKAVRDELERIAMKEDYALEVRGGIDGRNNDEEDFPELSIVALQEMLARAYMLGKNSRK